MRIHTIIIVIFISYLLFLFIIYSFKTNKNTRSYHYYIYTTGKSNLFPLKEYTRFIVSTTSFISLQGIGA